MDYIKKHKLTSFIILVYIVVIAFGFFIYNLFIGSSGLPVYGDRLDGIEDVPISEEQTDKIVKDLESEKVVAKVKEPYLSGKIFKVIITVTDNTSVADGKALASKVTGVLTEEQKKFYDIEIFVTKEYSCTLEATGNVDEEGNFVSDVTVKFQDDLSDIDSVTDYGINTKDAKEYNKDQKIKITEDGEHIIYGYTKDKGGEYKCSIKIVKKSEGTSSKTETINSITNRSYPFIGYQKQGTNKLIWTKDR